MKKPIKNLPHSIKGRLTDLARATGRPFNEVLQYYAIERFLFRLSSSSHSRHFVLKGGLVFYAQRIPLRRTTRDIDLRADAVSTVNEIENIMREVCLHAVEPDAMRYDPASVVSERIMPNEALQGVGVKCLAYLGVARVTIQIDVSYANVIIPEEVAITYPALLDSPPPRLRVYPYETVIAEKLQALVYFASENWRLKDYYDLWLLSQQVDFDGQTLSNAIRATFSHRNTAIPTDLPAGLTQEFADAQRAQWGVFLRTSVPSPEPVADLSRVLVQLREFLLPPMAAAARNSSFAATWIAGEAWTP